jgi:hypothetical protein
MGVAMNANSYAGKRAAQRVPTHTAMATAPRKPHHHPGHLQDPDDFEPNLLPVDPDQGPVPALIPTDPEHDRMVDPEA